MSIDWSKRQKQKLQPSPSEPTEQVEDTTYAKLVAHAKEAGLEVSPGSYIEAMLKVAAEETDDAYERVQDLIAATLPSADSI